MLFVNGGVKKLKGLIAQIASKYDIIGSSSPTLYRKVKVTRRVVLLNISAVTPTDVEQSYMAL